MYFLPFDHINQRSLKTLPIYANAVNFVMQQNRNISRGVTKRRNVDQPGESSSMDLGINVCSQTTDEDMSEITNHTPSLADDFSERTSSTDVAIPGMHSFVLVLILIHTINSGSD